MTDREKLIEKMARAICAVREQDGCPCWEAIEASWPDWLAHLKDQATAALTAVEHAGAVVVPVEGLGQRIYEALYAHQGGRWSAVETRGVWNDASARLLSTSPYRKDTP